MTSWWWRQLHLEEAGTHSEVALMVVREVDEEILSGHQLHDGVAQELHPLVVAPGKGKQQEEKRREGGEERGAVMSADGSQHQAFDWMPSKTITPRKQDRQRRTTGNTADTAV